MAPELYRPVYISIVSVLCLFFAFKFSTTPDSRFQQQRTDVIFPFILCIVLAIWLGNRPISGIYFSDTANYAWIYQLYNTDIGWTSIKLHWNSEWFWSFLMYICKSSGFDVHVFFTLIDIGYFLTAFWAIKRFVPSNPLVGMLFVLSSFMFFGFATNGIRNGLACHILLLAISFYLDDRYWAALFLGALALGTHFSVLLPIAAIFICRYALTDYRYAAAIWVISILVSATIGAQLTELASMFTMDDRMVGYLNSDDGIYQSGFRWDFLIYSAPPVVLAWIIIVQRGVKDNWYTIMSSAYCLANAFWVMVIRASYSNRFAYLSWFLYPVLIVYPILNMPVWHDQDKRIALSLLAYWGFTMVMYLWKGI